MSDITNVKVSDLVGKGKFTVTYAKVNENGTFGKEIRMLVKNKDGETFGFTTSAKQVITQFESCDICVETDKSSIIGRVVVFKAYPTTNGNTSIKMFFQR